MAKRWTEWHSGMHVRRRLALLSGAWLKEPSGEGSRARLKRAYARPARSWRGTAARPAPPCYRHDRRGASGRPAASPLIPAPDSVILRPIGARMQPELSRRGRSSLLEAIVGHVGAAAARDQTLGRICGRAHRADSSTARGSLSLSSATRIIASESHAEPGERRQRQVMGFPCAVSATRRRSAG
jgi:hypothetical protein